METKIEGFKNLDIRIDKYECPLCRIKFGTPGRKSGMVHVQDGERNLWTVCQECFEEREGKNLFKKEKKK